MGEQYKTGDMFEQHIFPQKKKWSETWRLPPRQGAFIRQKYGQFNNSGHGLKMGIQYSKY